MAVILNGTTQGIQTLGSPAAPLVLVQAWPAASGVGVSALTSTAAFAQLANDTNAFAISVSIGGDISSVTDSAGNTYVPGKSQTNGLYNLYVYSCIGINAFAAGNILSVVFTASVTCSIQGVEYSGVGGLDANVVSATGATANSTATLASQYPNAVVVCWAIGNSTSAPTAGTGFTSQTSGTATSLSYIMETSVQMAIGNVTCGVTGVGLTTWTTIAVALYQTRTPSTMDGTYTGFFKYVSGNAGDIFLIAGVQGDEFVALSIGTNTANQLTVSTLTTAFNSTVALTAAVWYHYAVTVRTLGTSQIITLFYKKVGDSVHTRVTSAAQVIVPSLPIILCYGIDNNDSNTNVLPSYDTFFSGTFSVQAFWWNIQLTQADIERESEQLEPVYPNPWSVLWLSTVADLTEQSGGSTQQYGWIGSTGTNTSDPPIPRTKPRRFVRKKATGGATTTLAPAGISSDEGNGAGSMGVTLSPSSISSSESLSPGSVGAPLLPAGVGSSEAEGSIVITRGLAVPGIASSEASGTTIETSGIGGAGILGHDSSIGRVSASVVAVLAGCSSSEGIGSSGILQGLALAGIGSGEGVGVVVVGLGIGASGIESAEDAGSISTVRGLAPAGVPSSEGIGVVVQTSIMSSAGIDSAEALSAVFIGTPLEPSGVASSESISPIAAAVSGIIPGVASSESVGALVMQQRVAPAGISSSESEGTSAVALTIAPAGVETAESIGATGTVQGLQLAGIPSSEASGSASTLSTQSVVVAGIESSERLGALQVAQGLAAAGIASGESVSFVGTSQGVAIVGIASAETVGVPLGGAPIAPTGISSSEGIGGAILARILAGSGIPSSEVVGIESITVTMRVVGISSDDGIGILSFANVQKISVAGISSDEGIGVEILTLAGMLAGIAGEEGLSAPSFAKVGSFAGLVSEEAIGFVVIVPLPPLPPFHPTVAIDLSQTTLRTGSESQIALSTALLSVTQFQTMSIGGAPPSTGGAVTQTTAPSTDGAGTQTKRST